MRTPATQTAFSLITQTQPPPKATLHFTWVEDPGLVAGPVAPVERRDAYAVERNARCPIHLDSIAKWHSL